MRLVPALLAVAVLVPARARAQAPDSVPVLRPGTLLRITSADENSRRRHGTFVALDSTAVTIRRPPPWAAKPIVLPLRDVQRIDVQIQRSRRGTSAFWCGLAGLAVSSIITFPSAAAAGEPGGEGSGDLRRFVVRTTAATALIGWVIAPGERWRELPLPRAGAAMAPVPPSSATVPATPPAAPARVASDTTLPRPGEVVRVHLREARARREGRLLAADSATLLVRVAPAWARNDQRIPLADVTRLDVQLRPGRRGRGALAGASYALLLGAIAATSLGGGPEALLIARGSYLVPILGGGAIFGAALAPSGEWVRVR